MEVLELEAPVAIKPAGIAPVSCDFVWITDDPIAPRGWRPALLPTFNAGSSFHTAHDTLEHLDHSDPSLEAEMRAFGAHLYLRALTPYWKIKNDLIRKEDPQQALMDLLRGEVHGPADTIAAKHLVGDLFDFLDFSKSRLAEPPNSPPLSTEAEHIMALAVSMGRRIGGDHVFGKRNKSKQDWEERIAYALGWMRIGYRAHEGRYAGLNEETRANMFLTIEKIVNKITRLPYNTDDLDQGDKLHVEVVFGRQKEVRATLDRARFPTLTETMYFV